MCEVQPVSAIQLASDTTTGAAEETLVGNFLSWLAGARATAAASVVRVLAFLDRLRAMVPVLEALRHAVPSAFAEVATKRARWGRGPTRRLREQKLEQSRGRVHDDSAVRGRTTP